MHTLPEVPAAVEATINTSVTRKANKLQQWTTIATVTAAVMTTAFVVYAYLYDRGVDSNQSADIYPWYCLEILLPRSLEPITPPLMWELILLSIIHTSRENVIQYISCLFLRY